MSPLGPILILCALATTLAAQEKRNATETRPLVIDWLSRSRDFNSLQIDFTQERQLKALRRPLSRQGKLWITKSGQLRWQIDDPASLLLVRAGSDAPLLWLDLKKQTWQELNPEDDRTQGNAQALQLMLQSQTATIDAFEAAFTLRGARRLPDTPGQWRLELDLKDRRVSLAVKDVFFHIEPATGALHLMEFQLRDGSLLRTRITRALKNPNLNPSLFNPDLTSLRQEP
jgi:outer membrane lipoprotein-sorting protein